jgi:hypothetical protein
MGKLLKADDTNVEHQTQTLGGSHDVMDVDDEVVEQPPASPEEIALEEPVAFTAEIEEDQVEQGPSGVHDSDDVIIVEDRPAGMRYDNSLRFDDGRAVIPAEELAKVIRYAERCWPYITNNLRDDFGRAMDILYEAFDSAK